jgi:hypothetical protein
MAKCGFCNENVSIDDFVSDKIFSFTTKASHVERRLIMFECPHFKSVLGFAHMGG